ncbi:thiamine phosphate phosphatase-like protein isoform X2 [Syzygium oleosum]|uniref:thiamine phosphate phosphatase-like protein isoform X2 n=1 Tax=Syzygium oleosum TaxID=219896 RepID=UPI0024BACF48|nr:thiamine phosphate phosphatase-like protein isoform X2 [Syzygium oleosum]
MAEVVAVFDFDKTILDCDSDDWVVDKLGLSEVFDRLRPTLPLNSLMDRMMMELHSRGKTMEEIADCLKEAPLHPKIVSAIKSAHASGCDLRILSDSNVFFIETILRHHGLIDCFSEINTNPGSVDAQGRLNISPYHDFYHLSHGCKICPPNMCKASLMDRIRSSASAERKKRFIYVGDGNADLCAGMKLEEADVLLPRKGFPVWDLICRNPTLIKARVREWTDAAELKTVLLNSAGTLGCAENGNAKAIHSIVVACKFQTSLVGAAAPESPVVRREREACSSIA